MKIGIVGGGILGRTIAQEFLRHNIAVSLFEKDSPLSDNSSSFVAAGMVAPWSELSESHEIVFKLACESLKLWPLILENLNANNAYMRTGTMHLASNLEENRLKYLLNKIKSLDSNFQYRCFSSKDEIAKEINTNSKFSYGIFFPKEIVCDPRKYMHYQNIYFKTNSQIKFKTFNEVTDIKDNKIIVDNVEHNFDLVICTQGIAAKKYNFGFNEQLRGVRGELLLVEAPFVNLTKCIRLMNIRQNLYIVPRGENKYLIGATSIESESMAAISCQSALELLSLAVQFDKAFLESSILDQRVHLRPAFTCHTPKIKKVNKHCYHINGLYRNGISISPAIANSFCNYILNDKNDEFINHILI